MLCSESISTWASAWASTESGKVDGHLVAIEVGVVAGADQWVDLDRVAFDQYRFEGLNTHTVQGWGAVERTGWFWITCSRMSQTSGSRRLKHSLRTLDGVGESMFLELADDERLVQLQGDLLGKTALPELEFRSNHNHGSCRIVHALAEQVFAEATLLALDHVGDRLQGAVADEPRTGRRQRPLSKRASTACCSMRFSLRMMTSGALRSISFLRRLFRLMMRR